MGNSERERSPVISEDEFVLSLILMGYKPVGSTMLSRSAYENSRGHRLTFTPEKLLKDKAQLIRLNTLDFEEPVYTTLFYHSALEYISKKKL